MKQFRVWLIALADWLIKKLEYRKVHLFQKILEDNIAP